MLNVDTDMGMKTWTLAWTSTYSMNMAWTWACSMNMAWSLDMNLDMQHVLVHVCVA
jgi:hypothetical protein